VGTCGVCSMLLGLRNGKIEVCFDLVVIGLHLHKDTISFGFVSLDLAAEVVDFICSMVQLTHECVPTVELSEA
jgi:hypothetical protein